MTESVGPTTVHWIGRVSLLGEGELRAFCYTLSGLAGTWLGVQIAGLLR
jgi:hypothetical protein